MYFLAHFLTYWLSCLYYLYHDSKIWNNLEEWNKVKIQKWKPNIKTLWVKNSLASLRNNFLSFLVISLLPNPTIRIDLWNDCWKFMCYLILIDIHFYTTHYALHTKYLYSYHKWHHKVSTSIASSALDADMLEHVIGNLGTIIVPYLMLGGSKCLFLFVIIFSTNHTCITHAGYKRANITHDIHHQLLKYNFGNVGIMDRLCGTYKKSI